MFEAGNIVTGTKKEKKKSKKKGKKNKGKGKKNGKNKSGTAMAPDKLYNLIFHNRNFNTAWILDNRYHDLRNV